MTAVSQLVPNFLGGINEQPDELKKPGQVRDCVNFLPDVTYGLTKRPGLEYLNKFDVEGDGTWIRYTKENNIGKPADYIGYISRPGEVFFWDAMTGEQQPVSYINNKLEPGKFYTADDMTQFNTSTYDEFKLSYTEEGDETTYYLKHGSNESSLKYISYKNNIIFTNPETRVEMNSNATRTANDPKDDAIINQSCLYYAFIEAKLFDNTRNYKFKIINLDSDEAVNRVVKEVTCIKHNRLNQDTDLSDITCPAVGTIRSQASETLDVSDNQTQTLRTRERITDPLIVDFIITGQQVTEGTDRCEYTVDANIVSGGLGFKKGDVVCFKVPLDRCIADSSDTFDAWIEIDEVRREYSKAGETIAIAEDITDLGDIDEILANLVTEIRNSEFFKNTPEQVEVVGNGIYVFADTPFLIDTTEFDLFNIINSEKTEEDVIPIGYVNNVSRLPITCKPGFRVRVLNSFVDEDDYYLEFKNSVEYDNVESPDDLGENVIITSSGEGFWEEIAKPFEKDRFRGRTMPHMITLTGSGFYVSRLPWKHRTVGTAEKFNPSFAEETQGRITDLNFYKNRLILLTDLGTVVSSASDDLTNLFPKTALSTGTSDPVDVVANNREATPLHSSIVTNNGLVIFGSNTQYQFFTNSDILSPQTVNITQIGNYEFDRNSTPQSLSTNICFVSGKKTRMYEMTNVFDRGQVDIAEKSKTVQNGFSKNYTKTASSRIYNMISFSNINDSTVWLYVYFKESSQEDQQTAWVKYQFPHNVKYIYFLDNSMYVITGTQGECYLTRLNLENADYSNTPQFRDYWQNLDVVPYNTDGLEIEEYVWTDGNTYSGIKYSSVLTLPRFYVNKSEKGSYQSDTTASLTLHRVKINHGGVGPYYFNLVRNGKDKYSVLYEQPYGDNLDASGNPNPVIYPWVEEQEQTLPIYDRNINVSMSLSTDFNAPCVIHSLRWEGDYTNRYYKRV